jgi:hypothetical protein
MTGEQDQLSALCVDLVDMAVAHYGCLEASASD